MIAAGRWDEADQLLSGALQRHPDDRNLATAHALAAHTRGAYKEAARRLRRARKLGATEPFVSSRLAEALRLTGKCELAEMLLDNALARYPNDIRVLTEAARLAQDMNCPQAAADHWRRAMVRAKPRADRLHARSLFLSGDIDGAARLVALARRLHPNYADLIATDTDIAAAREDWPQAIRCEPSTAGICRTTRSASKASATRFTIPSGARRRADARHECCDSKAWA